MPEQLKHMFGPAYYERLAGALSEVAPRFRAKEFVRENMEGVDGRELNARMRHTSHVLRRFLPEKFPAAVKVLREVAQRMPTGYTALLYPDFVGQFGLDHVSVSLDALKFFTRFGSSEFAVRHFFIRDVVGTLQRMREWAGDSCEHVRRLASESSRPRLPWSFRLEAVVREPSLTRPILDALRADASVYVRKSVANHLNDISKDHPDYMVGILEAWGRREAGTAWIAKHASRTLIKKGHAGALALFAFEKNTAVELSDLKLKPAVLRLGGPLEFTFTLRSMKHTPQKLVIDYRLHYAKAGGNTAAKVFKLKEVVLDGGGAIEVTKRQVIQDFSTRKHHAGTHRLEILVNGRVAGSGNFRLVIQ
jgi:3-methyladenine DNA glycosylase AlkC